MHNHVNVQRPQDVSKLIATARAARKYSHETGLHKSAEQINQRDNGIHKDTERRTDADRHAEKTIL